MGENLEINSKSSNRTRRDTWKPNNALLNKLWIIGNIREVIKTFQEANENEFTTNQTYGVQ